MSTIDFIESKIKSYYPTHHEAIMAGLRTPKKVTFRVNTLKSSKEAVLNTLLMHGLSVTPVDFSDIAFILNEGCEKDLQSLDIYDQGHIYLQSLSSMLPPIVLNPQKGDILDMAAAPGGKTTQIAAMTNQMANITACEQNPIRAQKLKYNLDKQGATKVTVITKDARQLDDFFRFDHILLDAPCSGSGTLDLNHEKSLQNFTEHLIQKSVQTQKALILKAIELLKPNQTMVYSTCSILKSENEDIVRFALKTNKVDIVPIDLTIEGVLPSDIPGIITVMPSALYEGFFIALLRKK
jgi:NOL1/NOP2/sun family putative RNA methylase